MKPQVKNILIYAALIAGMLVASYAFCPELLSGKIVNQSDISGWRGMAKESVDWNTAHPDDKTAWSDSMFGGMPNVTFIDNFEGDWTKPIYKLLLWGKRPASYLFLALVGAFLMMLSMGINRFLSAAGAVAVAFCSYNFQIIQVGHNTKMQAIAFAPWVIAALLYTYRSALGGKAGGRKGVGRFPFLPATLLGSVLFGLALSMQIKANHIQITYYLAIIILVYAIATFIWVLRKENRGRMSGFLLASALLLVAGIVGIGTNANKLIPTAAYAPYTMRGGSELKAEAALDRQGGDASASGLSLDYATAWSYGIEETPNLLIPNFNGGSSTGSLDKTSATWQLFQRARQNPSQLCKSLPLYWGPQPFTAGPMYLGAISIFLFVLGLFLLRGREKWWLAVCTVIALLLAWGSHIMPLTQLLFKYAPLYNKFRTVSMALVMLQYTVPLLGIYVLDRIHKDDFPHREVVKSTWWAFGLTAGFCALSALIPAIAGNFTAASDAGMQDVIADALRQDRRTLLQKDAWRSFILITASAGVILWSYFKQDPEKTRRRGVISAIVVACLILIDLWSVGGRYLNSSHFVRPRDFSAQMAERPVDKEILKDKSPSYRVMDLSENTFNSSRTSMRHKSVGGYSPTKMQRYQDLIDRYLSKEIKSFYKAVSNASTLEEIQAGVPVMPVSSMLNTRYIIVDGDYPPVVNPNAFGSAWLVDGVEEVSSATEEIDALGKVDLAATAVVRKGALSAGAPAKGARGAVTITSYAPNELHYSFATSAPAVAVFSEIYHPDWEATVKVVSPDGSFLTRSLPLFQADWVLRGAVLPEGEGEVVMRYTPEDYSVGAAISKACSAALLLLLVVSLGWMALMRSKVQDI